MSVSPYIRWLGLTQDNQSRRLEFQKPIEFGVRIVPIRYLLVFEITPSQAYEMSEPGRRQHKTIQMLLLTVEAKHKACLSSHHARDEWCSTFVRYVFCQHSLVNLTKLGIANDDNETSPGVYVTKNFKDTSDVNKLCDQKFPSVY